MSATDRLGLGLQGPAFAPRSIGNFFNRFFHSAPLWSRAVLIAYFLMFFLSPLFGIDEANELVELIQGVGLGALDVVLFLAAFSIWHFNQSLEGDERGSGRLVFFMVISPLVLGIMAMLIGLWNTGLEVHMMRAASSFFIVIPLLFVLLTAFDSVIRCNNSESEELTLIFLAMSEVFITIYTFAVLFYLNDYVVDVMGDKPSFWGALYFSGVTFTTIGYGDILPVGMGGALAVVEALMGIVTMSLVTAIFIRIIGTHGE